MSKTITVKVRGKRASTVRGAYLVSDNTDYQITFDFDVAWAAHTQKTCRILIGLNYVDVPFSGSTVALPRLTAAADHILVGVYAGDLETTSPALIPVLRSILGYQATEYDPDYPATPGMADALDPADIIRVNQGPTGTPAKARIGQILALAAGADYTIHVVNGTVTETPADIAAAFADSTRRVVLDVDGVVLERYNHLGAANEYGPDVYLFYQPFAAMLTAIECRMLMMGLYLSPSAATVSEQLYSTLLTVGDNVSRLVNDVGYLTEQSLSEYRTAEAQDIIDQAQDTAIAAKYSKPDDGIPASDLASDVQTSLGKADTALQTAPVSSVNGQTGAVVLGAADVGADPAVTEVTVASTGAVTQALDAGKMYHFTGALTSLTLTLNAATSGQLAQYHFDFVEGSTAFDPTLPSGVKLPDNHTWEADKRYEVDILNNYAVIVGWAVS